MRFTFSRALSGHLVAFSGTILIAAGLTTTGAAPSHASEPTLDDLVSANPADWTPNVNDGQVNATVQIGNRIIAVGDFTTVKALTSAKSATRKTLVRHGIFAFNAKTGVIDNAFAPDLGTKEVYDIAKADDGTIYIGGAFSSVNGVKMTAKVARLNATTGAVVKKFKAPKLGGGKVTDLQVANSNLYIGGSFTTVAGQPRTLLAALDPITGDDTGAVDFTFTDTWNGGHLGIVHFDISDDGGTLVAVGNWRNVNGESRPQIMTADLTATASTLSGWATQRFAIACDQTVDTYMRDVDIAPTGDYFAVVTAGSYNGNLASGTLCDSASRWEIGPTTMGQDPSWVDYTGGDSLTQIKITGAAIYVGGHLRWLNNPHGSNQQSLGAVARTGLAAIDPRNGLPFSWNPTRIRGVGVFELMPTDDGLWVGHDSSQIGKEYRKRIALFPTAAGTTLPLDNTGALPNDVFLLAPADSTGSGHWVARVNAGGPTVDATDDGPDWSADDIDHATAARNYQSIREDWGDSAITRDASVPASTPTDIFSTDRFSDTNYPTLQWNFPAPVGDTLTVRLYFAESCTCDVGTGQRTFDVELDGAKVLDSYDVVGEVGNDVATMEDFTISSDGNVDIDFVNHSGKAMINGIEIINNDVPASASSDAAVVVDRGFDGSNVDDDGSVKSGGIDWDDARGAVMIDDTLYSGWSDGTLQARTFNGTTFGTATEVDLNGLDDSAEAAEASVNTFSDALATATGMFFDSTTGRLYYTVWNKPGLYYRYFTPESQIIGAVEFTAPTNQSGIDWWDTDGMFLDGDTLYVGSSLTGNLAKVSWDSQTASLSGTATDVSGPDIDGYDWRARGAFIYAG